MSINKYFRTIQLSQIKKQFLYDLNFLKLLLTSVKLINITFLYINQQTNSFDMIILFKDQLRTKSQIEHRMNTQYKPYFTNPTFKIKTNQNEVFISDQENPINRRMSENLQNISSHKQIPSQFQRLNNNINFSRVKETSPRPNHNSIMVSRDRSLTPTMTNISQIEDRYKKIQLILNDQNGNLKAQNQYIKAEVKRLYERQKKHKTAIKKYKLIIEQLKLENQIYQDRYQELKIYVSEVVSKLSQLEQNQSNEQILQYSNEAIDNLKKEFSLQNILMDGKKNCSSSKITSDIQQTKNQQQENLNQMNLMHSHNHNHSNSNRNYMESYYQQYPSASEQYKNVPMLTSEMDKNKNYSQNQKILKLQKPPYFSLDTNNFTVYQQVGQNGFNFNEVLCSQSQYNIKIQQLSDQFQALMYEYKKSNNKDKQIRKKAISISQQIKRLKGLKQKLSFQQRQRSRKVQV